MLRNHGGVSAEQISEQGRNDNLRRVARLKKRIKELEEGLKGEIEWLVAKADNYGGHPAVMLGGRAKELSALLAPLAPQEERT